MQLQRVKLLVLLITLVALFTMITPASAAASEADSQSTSSVDKNLPEKGINYLSQWHWYNPTYTTDEILQRDFSRFKNDGIKYIRIPLYWYRLEGNTKGDFTSSIWYGNAFLDNIKRVINTANKYGIETMVDIHTLWGSDSLWCTPDYVIDPVTGSNDGLAVVRSQEMQNAFIDMFSHTVEYLKGTPGIWCWALNEPWYSPDTLPAPFDKIDQKENFITLFQRMEKIVKSSDGKPFTVCFPSVHSESQYVTDIFADNWNWDERIFEILDFVTFTTYLPDNPSLLKDWQTIMGKNILGCNQKGTKVWIAEFGSKDADGNQGVEAYKIMLDYLLTLPVEGILPWMWRSDTSINNPETPGTGYNICANVTTGIGDKRYSMFLDEMAGHQSVP